MLPSPTQIKFLTAATDKYLLSMNRETAGYLLARGITRDAAFDFRLGYVAEPEAGHEAMQGRLSIPYITRSGVVNIKARCIEDHDCKKLKHPKYLAPMESGQFLYNAKVLGGDQDFMCVTEGELDALALQIAGLPAVGVPGVAAWKANKHWASCFTGYQRVYLFPDNDKKGDGRNPGMDLARSISATIENTSTITLPPNEDVSTCLVKYGAGYLRSKVGL